MSINSITKSSTISTAFLTAVLLSYAGSASAITFNLNGTSGTWSNFQGPGAPGTFQQVGSESQVRWGDSNSTFLNKSGLGFTGVGSSSLGLNETFQLATLRHFNNPISIGTEAEAVDLSMDVNLAGLGIKTFDFTLGIDETLNSGICRYPSLIPCSDRISINNLRASENFSQGGKTYQLKLSGFEIVEGNLFNLTSWTTEEYAISEVNLVAEIIQVPEPTVLAGLSLLGFYFVTGRRKQKL